MPKVLEAAGVVLLALAAALSIRAMAPPHKAVPDLVRFDPRLDTRLLRLLTADRSPDSWKLKHCAPAGAELRVVVEASGAAEVPVRLVEAFDGLPADAGHRGEGLVPATSGDLCLVGRRLRI